MLMARGCSVPSSESTVGKFELYNVLILLNVCCYLVNPVNPGINISNHSKWYYHIHELATFAFDLCINYIQCVNKLQSAE